jgi:hypothetical protein
MKLDILVVLIAMYHLDVRVPGQAPIIAQVLEQHYV